MTEANDFESSNEAELARLMELQRLEQQAFLNHIDFNDIDSDASDFDVRRRSSTSAVLRPPMPDLRFGQQFNKTVENLQANGASGASIFFSAVIKDQIIIPFVSGFTWSLGSHLWRWYRPRRKPVNAGNSNGNGFLTRLYTRFSLWASNTYHTLVRLPSIVPEIKQTITSS
ncbi:uncharacterized protein BYT42DRAFT_609169 [Radiomyces spectabilis]|uniref:uncharacterized protein n=1 Tax=Radiomyces spectabilis TaxID=64574 RepID=UPI00221F9291|nr:uncharacterized protein BYT42DRAFT_609169 [Radiomyces spectabilis]KAI8393372.1 hypothetical protein BYT42DRAFT_609169 [Radiomyces spectabilis]